MQSMPGFGERLSDADVAELVNYLRVTWGGLPADVTAEQVKALRK
jgi:mono/diheme cytochrome c family protein